MRNAHLDIGGPTGARAQRRRWALCDARFTWTSHGRRVVGVWATTVYGPRHGRQLARLGYQVPWRAHAPSPESVQPVQTLRANGPRHIIVDIIDEWRDGRTV
jgi:hypothetical protein